EDISFQAIPGTETYPKGLRIWIDENKDGEFSTDEIAYTSPGIINGTHNGSFTVPIIDAGDYRMRVIIMYYSSEIDPCEDGSYWVGEAEDYTLTVLEGDEPAPASPYAAVALTGFNADVIAEGSGVPTSSTT